MLVRCWGSRGSIPVSGQQYNRYGGDTTAMEVITRDGEHIVIDAGSGIRCLGNKYMKDDVRDIHTLFTHAHWDHLMGFPFFKPVFKKNVSVTVYGCPFEASSYKTILEGLMSGPYFPVELRELKAKLRFRSVSTQRFKIGSVSVRPIYLNHPNGGLGYRFEENGNSFVFLTDNELDFDHPRGLTYDDYARFCEDTDLLIHDAEFTKKDYRHNRSWGHSLFTDALKLALDARVKRLGLFHLNQDRTDSQVDAMVEQCEKLIAKNKSTLQCFGVHKGFEIKL